MHYFDVNYLYAGSTGQDWSDVEQEVQEAVWPHYKGEVTSPG